VPAGLLRELLANVKTIFMTEPIILEAKPPVTVVGDIHGHILDLIRILKEQGLPLETRYLFLGDYIDRGEMNTETIILIFVLKALYPDHILLIRGNHEFPDFADHSAFYSELYSLYNDEKMKDLFMDAFNYMPLAADIGSFAFCVHGGICPSFYYISQLMEVERPILDFSNELVRDVLWSDPDSSVEFYGPSPRGFGVLFGTKAIDQFLVRTGFRFLVRGHQSISKGCESTCNFKVITVFSASNYCGGDMNKAGVLKLLPGDTYETVIYEAFQFMKRYQVTLTPLDLLVSERKAEAKKKPPKLSLTGKFVPKQLFAVDDSTRCTSSRGLAAKERIVGSTFTSRGGDVAQSKTQTSLRRAISQLKR
jgi:protein phosphatase